MMKSCHPTGKALGLLVVRLVLGFLFIYAGLAKLIWMRELSAGMFGTLGLPGSGAFWNYLVGGLEFLGGVMLVLGAWARYAATWLAVIMLFAMWYTRSLGLQGMMAPLAIFGGLAGLMGTGAGKWRLVATECHCRDCKEAMSGGCGGGCGGGGCGCGKNESKASAPMAAPADDGCCGGGCCSSGLEEKK